MIGRRAPTAPSSAKTPWWTWLMLALLIIPAAVLWLSPDLSPGPLPNQTKVIKLPKSGWLLKRTDYLKAGRGGVESSYTLLRGALQSQISGRTETRPTLMVLGCQGKQPVKADFLFVGPFNDQYAERLTPADLCLMELRPEGGERTQITCDFTARSETSVIQTSVPVPALVSAAGRGGLLAVELMGPFGSITTASFDVSGFSEAQAVLRGRCVEP